MLMSPAFLYRTELGDYINGRFQLNAYEVAALLSYTFIGSSPDALLQQASLSGELISQAQLRTQVERLLKLPEAEANMLHFSRQWLETKDTVTLNKDERYFPDYSASVREAMNEEFDLFLTDILLGQEKDIDDFFNADYTYANPPLADYYGISAGGNAFDKVNAGNHRGGILRMGAVLANKGEDSSTSPILRGKFVRERLMCQELPPPPVNVDATPPALDFSKPTRERFESHTAEASCQNCHQYMDPIGFSFEQYDGAGKFRHTEAGKSIDTSGHIIGLINLIDDETHHISGVDDLSNTLASSEGTALCVVEQFERFSSGVGETEACTIENTTERWRTSGYNFKQLWLEMVSSKLYLIRQ